MTTETPTTEQEQGEWVLVHDDWRVIMRSLRNVRAVFVKPKGNYVVNADAQRTMRDPAKVLNVSAYPGVVKALQLIPESCGFGDATAPGQPSQPDGGPVNVTYFSQETVDAIRAALSAVHPAEGANR